ncbi:MAG: hypothetical protein WCL50_10205 [Spirochaetota bacterium]
MRARAAVLPLAALLLTSCAANIAARLEQTGAASISVKASLPPLIAAKLRRLGGIPETTPLFDLRAVRASLASRSGLVIRSLSNPSPDSLGFAAETGNLEAALYQPETDDPGILSLRSSRGQTELVLRLVRGQGSAIAALAPGLDPDILEALAPPALDAGDWSRAEYREMLADILGSKILPELDAATIDCAVSLPGKIVSSKGGTIEGSTWKFSIPLFDLLVLEKPIEYRVRWQP